MGVSSPPANSDYTALFRSYVEQNTRAVHARVQQSPDFLSKEEREQALHTLSFALKLSEAWPPARDLLLELAPAMEQTGNREAWISVLQRGIQQSQQLADSEAEAELLFQLGLLHRLQSNFDAARAAFEACAAYSEASDDPYRHARALNRLAYMACVQRQLPQARSLVEQALQLAQGWQAEEAYSYLVLGLLTLAENQFPLSKEYSESSLALWRQIGDQRMVARVLSNLGLLLRRMEKFDEAVAVYQQAIALFEELHDLLHLAAARMNLGNVYIGLEKYTLALEQYQRATPTYQDIDAKHNLAILASNKALAFHKLGQFKEAQLALEHAIPTWRALELTRSLVNALEGLSEALMAQGEFTQAIATLEQAFAALEQIPDDPDYLDAKARLLEHLAAAEEEVQEE